MARLLSPHFSEDEFWCHGSDQGTCTCRHSLYINPRLIELLEQLRYNIGGYPLMINSAYRCPAHNRSLGSTNNSEHVKGCAADVACPPELSIDEFKWYALQLPFDSIGVYYPNAGNFLHLGGRDNFCGFGDWEERYHWEYR